MKSFGKRLIAMSSLALLIAFVVYMSADSSRASAQLLGQMGMLGALGILGLLVGVGAWLIGVAAGRGDGPSSAANVLLGIIAFVSVVIVAAAAPSPSASPSTAGVSAISTSGTAPTTRPAPAGPSLALLSSTCQVTSSESYVECEGAVKNISNEPIENVQVVVIWNDASGVPQRSDSSYVDFDPLLAGQTSTWSVFGRNNPALTKYVIAFKTLVGGEINYRDDRP